MDGNGAGIQGVRKDREGLFGLSVFQKGPSESVLCVRKSWEQGNDLAEFLDGLIVLAGEIEDARDTDVDDGDHRLHLDRALRMVHGFNVGRSQTGQIERVQLMRQAIVGLESQHPVEALPGYR